MTQENDKVVYLKRTIETERRKEQRIRALKGATIRFNGCYGAFEGVVRNQSPSGARLDFGDALGVPPRFELNVPSDATSRIAEVRWRGDRQVGVVLIDEAS